jgi:hypothetical protein
VNVPDWWGAVLLALAAWRTFQLIARDDGPFFIIDRARRWVLRLGNWKVGERTPASYRQNLGDFVTCPYCAGFWITLAWWGAWQIDGRITLIVAAPFALMAGLIAADKVLGSE